MADLRDEHGNPIQLTDEHGNPVQLTDEHGNPVHITGIASSKPLSTETVTVQKDVSDTGLLASSGMEDAPKSEHVVGGDGEKQHIKEEEQLQQQQKDESSKEVDRSSCSSSGSSEEDEQGGRRKKKGLRQKIKDKLTGGKHKEGHGQTVSSTTTTTTAGGAGGGEHHENEKKSVMEKIKEKLPDHHAN